MDDRIAARAGFDASPTPDERCGTPAGYQAHRARKEKHCEPCRVALRAYERKRVADLRSGLRQPREAARCGTVSGYQVHVRKGEVTCAECRSAMRVENRRKKEQNPDRYMRASRRSNWRLQGIDPDEAERLLAAHDGTCEICGTTTPGERNWHVDHDHATGRVRGILCGSCNKGLGQFKDSPSTLIAAAAYLNRALKVEP